MKLKRVIPILGLTLALTAATACGSKAEELLQIHFLHIFGTSPLILHTAGAHCFDDVGLRYDEDRNLNQHHNDLRRGGRTGTLQTDIRRSSF